MQIISIFKDKVVGFFDNRFIKRKQFIGDPNLLDEDYEVIRQVAPTKITENLLKYAYLTDSEVFEAMDSGYHGLSHDKVEERIEQYGYNQVEQEKELTALKHLWLCYKNPFNLLLTILAIISFLTEDLQATTVIGLMVIISTILRFVQERRSNNAADALKAMVSTTTTVLRLEDNKTEEELAELEREVRLNLRNSKTKSLSIEVPIKELVPGDVIIVSAGDMFPADVRVVQSKDLFVSQAALTGEALPVEKYAYPMTEGINNALELETIGFMGSNVVSGTATAIVIATGKSTLFGSLADKVISQDYVETSFQKGVNKVSWMLIYFMLVMTPIVLLINGFTKHDWVQAALFSLSIAVGLTPEMLPMIVTSTLAKGAVFMSRKKVIVKRLDAIQNFGAMDILCTDKTGTLTQDKICLEKHTDVFGNEFDEVLEYAYLNSYFQTGLKNLLDVAVLERGNFGNIPEIIKRIRKIDEVPFDFQRRRMSVVVTDNDEQHTLICKGAVEEMLNCCSGVYHNHEVLPLTDELLEKLRSVTAELNADGLRVVAVAIKHYLEMKEVYSVEDEYNLILVGYIAFLDPPKETTQPAIEALSRHGVTVKILTGDNELVTAKVCREVGLDVEGMMLGADIDKLSDSELARLAESTTVFAKLTPAHKERIVTVLHENGHVVGFMGDGINDAPALRVADIGISVDSAVDIAKEAADIILLEKSLMVLEHGVEEGRKTFANMLKYIKITASSNFGNVFSVLIASAFLPFEPMLPIHLLIQNLLYDISQIVIPFDNVDKEFLVEPQKWNPKGLLSFMIFFGPLSSIFDVITFVVLWNVYGAQTLDHASLFQSGWFVEGLVTQTLVVHMIRTRKIPFLQSRAAWPMIFMTLAIVVIGIMLPMGPFAQYVHMEKLPVSYFGWLVVIILGYMTLVQLMKGFYDRKFGWQ